MKKIIALALSALVLTGCAGAPEAKQIKPEAKYFEGGAFWFDDVRSEVEFLGIKCDAWEDPEPSLDGTVKCSETVFFTNGGLILNEKGEDEKGIMKSLADLAAKDYGRSSAYAHNMMIIAEGEELTKIADAFHWTIVRPQE